MRRQNPANRGATDLQPAGNLGFAETGPMQFSDFRSVHSCGSRPTEPFAVSTGVGQACPGSFPQDFPFELGEDGQQARHGAPGWGGQV
jgi:hypothetical protein